MKASSLFKSSETSWIFIEAKFSSNIPEFFISSIPGRLSNVPKPKCKRKSSVVPQRIGLPGTSFRPPGAIQPNSIN